MVRAVISTNLPWVPLYRKTHRQQRRPAPNLSPPTSDGWCPREGRPGGPTSSWRRRHPAGWAWSFSSVSGGGWWVWWWKVDWNTETTWCWCWPATGPNKGTDESSMWPRIWRKDRRRNISMHTNNWWKLKREIYQSKRSVDYIETKLYISSHS